MCRSTSPPPVAEVVESTDNHEDDEDEMPVLEPEEPIRVEVNDAGIELQLILSIAEAAREQQRLLQTVHQYQVAIGQQEALLDQRIQQHLEGGGENNNDGDEEEDDIEIDVVTVDEDMPPPDLEEPEGDENTPSF